MLESMITSPVPTRAEVSDVATAIFDGADAVMLSAESAAGQYPVEAVATMNRIAEEVEGDTLYRTIIDAQRAEPEATGADAIADAARHIAETLDLAAVVCWTTSGSTGLRVARERPKPPIVALSPNVATGRRLSVVWGVHCVVTEDAHDQDDMVERACRIAFKEGFAKAGQRVIVVAGVPLGTPGATNMLRIAYVGARRRGSEGRRATQAEKAFDMSGVSIRPATPADVAAITRIYARSVETGTASFELAPPDETEMARRMRELTANGFPYIVAEIDGVVAGYAYVAAFRARPAFRATIENSVYVATEFYRRGIGRALLLRAHRGGGGARLSPDGRRHRRLRPIRRHRSACMRRPGLRKSASCRTSASSTAAGWTAYSCSGSLAMARARRQKKHKKADRG